MRIFVLKVITLFFGGSLLAAVVLAEPSQLPLKQITLGLVVSLTGPSASEAAQSNPWFFTNGLSIGSTLKAIQYAFDKLKLSSIAIIVPNVPFGVAHADAIEGLVKQRGVEARALSISKDGRLVPFAGSR